MSDRGKKIVISICLVFLPLFLSCQNLVPNPSFENYTSCTEPVTTANTLLYVDNWFNAVDPLSTVRWYSTCFPAGSFYQIPNLYFGYSYAHLGEAMVGFGPYSPITNSGESLGIRLDTPLVADSAYCFGFWVKNSQNHNSGYSIHEFEVAFVNDTAGINSKYDIPVYTTLANLDDNNGQWNLLSKYYIATGGEEYMLIGAFNPIINYTMPTPPNGPDTYMYYYFDDVFVEPCNKDSLLAVVLELPNVLTLNGDQINDLYVIKTNNLKTLDIVVMNRWGNVVKSYNGLTTIWDGTDNSGNVVSEGVYFIKATAETNFGDMLSKQQFVQIYDK